MNEFSNDTYDVFNKEMQVDHHEIRKLNQTEGIRLFKGETKK